MHGDLWDEHGRLLPGSVPGWGMSWWFWEQRLVAAEMEPGERLRAVVDYWAAVNTGWDPPVPREGWVGPHHPCDSQEPDPRAAIPTDRDP